MARLPIVGSDTDQWGSLVNTFMQVEHNADGTHNISAPWQFIYGMTGPVAGVISPRAYIAVATTLTAFRAYRPDGTGAVIDLLKNGVSILSAQLSLTSTATWMTATFASTALVVGDYLQVQWVSLTGSPSELATSTEGTRTLS